MIKFLKREFQELTRFLKNNRNELIVTGTTALALTLEKYNPIWNRWFTSFAYFAFLPILVNLVPLRDNPKDSGFQHGNTRIWGVYVLITCILAIPVLYFASRIALFQNYYRIEQFNLLNYSLANCAYLFGVEYLFRGFLIFGLKQKLKEWSIIIQMLPFVLFHFGKPELETISTVITGVYFGYVVYRGNSFWPAYLIHIFINIFFVACVNLL